MRVTKCRKHVASKPYKYYNGIINVGDTYFRGLAVTKNNVPFEFFFTDKSIFEKHIISAKTLIQELYIYYKDRRGLIA